MSEKSQRLSRVIFDDMLKHEKEDVAEQNRKVKNLQDELYEAWFVVRVRKQAPETRHMKNPHEKISEKYFSVKRLFDNKLDDLLWKYKVGRKKQEKIITETMYNRKHDEETTRNILMQINRDNSFSEDEIINSFLQLKREIIDTQENFSDLQYQNAIEKLNKHHITDRDQIKDLDRRLAVMEFNDTDVMQAISQIKAAPLEKPYEIFPGLLSTTFYSAGHVEGSVQTVLTISNEKGESVNIMYTGDMGRSKQPGLSGKPAIPREELSYVMMEGTYAGRVHNDRMAERDKLIDDINHCKSMTLLPCFALQRFQEIICMLVDAVHHKKLKLGHGEKIYCQSPLAM